MTKAVNPGKAAEPTGASRTGTQRVLPTLLERKESELWRVSLLLLVLLAATLAGAYWQTLIRLPTRALHELAAMPASVFLIVVFAAYVWKKKREIAELRGYLRGFQQGAGSPPTAEQLEQLLETLSKSQQGYRDLIDSLDDVVLTIGLDGKLRAVNRSCTDLVEEPFAKVIGHSLDEFVEEPTRSVLEKALPGFLEKRHWAGVVRIRLKKTGGVRYLDCVLRAVVKEGEVTGVTCLGRDVTYQRESEARFTELFETLQEGIYFTTPEGKLLDANPALVRMLGYASKEELMEVNVRDLYAEPELRPQLLKELEGQGALRQQEIVLRRKEGSRIICMDTTTAIHDATGRVIRYQGTLVDISERRRMEQRLHEEQEFARRLVDSFPDLIVVVDPDERYRYVSPRIFELLGYTPEELVGKRVGERSHPEDSRAMLDLCHRVLQGEATFGHVEYRTRHKDGSWRIFRATVSPLYDTQGRITGLIASSRDVTEVKRLEQQVIQSEKLAAMGQLVAGVAHELNNPLTAILGLSDLLKERAAEENTRRQLELMNEQARRAAGIVQNLLAFSRPAAPQKTRINLNDLVGRSLQLHEYSLRVNNIQVDLVPQTGLPLVIGDTNQLMQVFLNLIVNAEQAIREAKEGGILRVRLGCEAGGKGRVWVSFEDNGAGIPPNLVSKIFDPFFTTKRPGRGTGLGLSICLALVREHRGNIEVQSTVGRGTTITVSLPVAEELPATQSAAFRTAPAPLVGGAQGPTPGGGAAGAELKGHSILVVDDEESIRELIETGLSARGVQVHCVSSGEEALDRTKNSAFDAILCDVKMPGLSGEQVYAQLRARPEGKNQRFIFMTGDWVDSETLSFLKGSGARVVQKPFRISDLVAVLTEVVGSRTGPESSRVN